jgi:pimeloyl-ACP methyl ester carboxylesterase
MKVYFISGLAADRRAFKHIELPSGFQAEYLDWITPLQSETLKDYSLRLAEKIDSGHPFVLIGLSMGGMVASEISGKYKPAKTIIISSVPASSQLPSYFRLAKKFKLYKLIPTQLIKSAAITKRIFTRESNEDKIILRKMINESSDVFIKWAIRAIVAWNKEDMPSSYIHIHGTSDELFPVSLVKPTHIINNGGHFMVMTHSNKINQILANTLMNLEGK